MSKRTSLSLATACLVTVLLAGCANDGGGVFGGGSTASLAEEPKVRPECVSLSARIETLRKEGVTERAAQAAATGKAATVTVKRTSLAQLAELDKANADFQAKCSNLPPRAVASVAPTPAPTKSAMPASAPPTPAAAGARTAKAAKAKAEAAEGPVTAQ